MVVGLFGLVVCVWLEREVGKVGGGTAVPLRIGYMASSVEPPQFCCEFARSGKVGRCTLYSKILTNRRFFSSLNPIKKVDKISHHKSS